MKKEVKETLIENLGIFTLFTLFIVMLNLAYNSLNYDIAWCFHISQKVANGYTMYSEISTVVTPIYFWIGGLFIKIFGNSLISMAIYSGVVQGVIATTVYNITKEVIEKKNDYLMPIFIFFMLQYSMILSLTNYNSTAMMWVLIAVFFELRREKTGKTKYNYITGIFLGLAFFTKQNIGTFAVIATGLISLINNLYFKKQNPMKEIFQKAAGFLGVMVIMLIYFFTTGTFMNFIDFCVGGLLEFGAENFNPDFSAVFVVLIIIITISFCLAFDKKKPDNILFIILIYLLGMFMIIYPLTNTYHAVLGMLLTLPLLIRVASKLQEHNDIYRIFLALTVLWSRMSINLFKAPKQTESENIFGDPMYILNAAIMITTFVIFVILIIGILKEKYEKTNKLILECVIVTILAIVCVHGYNLYINPDVPKGLEIYANHGYTEKQMNYIETVINYILQKEDEGYNVYVVSADASYYMAALGRNNYKYDLTLYGSLGYNGEQRLIEETKQLKDPIILKDKNVMFQEPLEFDKYIKSNYKVIDQIENLVVYAHSGDVR